MYREGGTRSRSRGDGRRRRNRSRARRRKRSSRHGVPRKEKARHQGLSLQGRDSTRSIEVADGAFLDGGSTLAPQVARRR